MEKVKQNKNSLTLHSYEMGADLYIARTPKTYNNSHEPLLRWINGSLQRLRPGSKILEIGSAFNRDAKYMREKGYLVQTSDATPAFVEKLRSDGEQALRIDVLNDLLPREHFDMVYANAVMQHFTTDEFNVILQKIYDFLEPGGLFALCVKQGVGEKWIAEKSLGPRYINYWEIDSLNKAAKAVGFKTVYLETDTYGDLPSHVWIHLTLKKSRVPKMWQKLNISPLF